MGKRKEVNGGNMKIKLKEIEWNVDIDDGWDNELLDEKVRPLYFTITIIKLILEYCNWNNLFSYLFCPIITLVLTIMFVIIDLLFLPFKLLYMIEVEI